MPDPVRFAVVGLGRIGRRHAELIRNNRDCMLSAVVDIRERSEVVKGGLDDISYFPSLDSFLSDGPEVDVVSVATPNGLHAEQGIKLLESGKHVVIEKPLTLSSGDAARLLDCEQETGRHIFVVMQNRYSPPIQWLKEMVESGRLGRIFLVQLNCFWNRDNRYYSSGTWHGDELLDGGTLFTQFSHFIDIMYWLFGDIANIQSRFFDFNHKESTAFEDSGMIHFDFVKGGSGMMNFSTSVCDRNMESSITILAENGSIRIGGQYMDRLEYCHIPGYGAPDLPSTNPGNDYGTHQGSAQNHEYVIRNVVDVLRGKARVATPASEGYKVVDIIERMYAAGDRPLKKRIAGNK